MVRILTVLLFALALLLGVMMVRRAQDVHRGLPLDLPEELSGDLFADWLVFVSPNGDFKVKFPGIPLPVNEKLSLPDTDLTLDYNMYASDDLSGTTFLISTIQYPPDFELTPVDAVLENVMEEMQRSDSSNRVVKLEFFDYKGFRALDFSIENAESRLENRVFLRDKTLYLLTLVDKQDQYIEEEFRFFISSFEPL